MNTLWATVYLENAIGVSLKNQKYGYNKANTEDKMEIAIGAPRGLENFVATFGTHQQSLQKVD